MSANSGRALVAMCRTLAQRHRWTVSTSGADWVVRIESPVVMTTCEVHSIASAERVEKLRQADSSRAIGVFSFVGSWRNTRITPMAHLTVDPPKPTTPRDSYDPKEAAIAKLSSIRSYQPPRLRSGNVDKGVRAVLA